MNTRIIDEYDPFPVLGKAGAPGRAMVKVPEDDEARVTVYAAGIVVDLIANDDGTLYIEAYAYDGRNRQAIAGRANLDRYTTRHPSLTLALADRPGGCRCGVHPQTMWPESVHQPYCPLAKWTEAELREAYGK